MIFDVVTLFSVMSHGPLAEVGFSRAPGARDLSACAYTTFADGAWDAITRSTTRPTAAEAEWC